MDYSEALAYIHSLGNFSKPAGLDRIKLLLKRLGDPQNSFKAIHIAGTNGKGSVAAMLSTVFKKAGFKTGLFISPYIINFRERIQINGEFISEKELTEICRVVKNKGIEVTEFEFITAVAFLYFKIKKCDIVIAETGLGGRLDATNTLENVAATVITKIGLDHTAVLGDSIEKITAEKCGIIKSAPVITSPFQRKNVHKIMRKYTDKLIIPDASQLKNLNCENSFLYKGEEYRLSLAGAHQTENALCVIEAIKNSGYDIPHHIIYKGLSETFFPARLEIISYNPLIILDGAHNPDGAQTLADYLDGKNISTAIIGAMKDKDYREVLGKVLPKVKTAVAVRVEGMPRSLDEKTLCMAASQYCSCVTAERYDEALEKAEELSAGGGIVIFGSLYLASGIREKLKK